MRVAVGAVAKKILSDLGIEIANHVVNFGGKEIAVPDDLTVQDIKATAGQNDLSLADTSRAQEIRDYIDQIKKEGDTIGGIIEVRVENMPAGLGSYVHYDRKLDAKLAADIVSINAFKGVEFGLGFQAGKLQGSQVMDEIIWDSESGYSRKSNHLGGFEGGMTNGQPIIVRAVMKPIPTLYKPLMSVDKETHEPYKASVERSDPTALPAAGVVMENVVATVLAVEICDKFSSDTMPELKESFEKYKIRLNEF
jgi:chorismate synthase